MEGNECLLCGVFFSFSFVFLLVPTIFLALFLSPLSLPRGKSASGGTKKALLPSPSPLRYVPSSLSRQDSCPFLPSSTRIELCLVRLRFNERMHRGGERTREPAMWPRLNEHMQSHPTYRGAAEAFTNFLSSDHEELFFNINITRNMTSKAFIRSRSPTSISPRH